ncbi:MAG: peptide deformylase [Dehalococcoidales bacterium]|jgi:peptide deformylase|nr:peptide deformylase [Dehalococcoidales bacterium]MDP6737926.1 peptide deformylase [Dehalococcoidales bacterium]|tara:strand:- start:1686 stop:2177 length:492 start_codon:yes stop_codon:yes gene_type:complete
MAILPIRLAPDPILRQKAKRVKYFDGSTQKLIGDMQETMHAAEGIGLAAPQVGVPLRIIVIGLPEEEDIVLLNPQVVRKTGERVVDESCLSIPGYVGEVKRAISLIVKARDPSGKEIRIRGEKVLSHALEHEIDHINGILYIDHLETPDKLRKLKPTEAEAQS